VKSKEQIPDQVTKQSPKPTIRAPIQELKTPSKISQTSKDILVSTSKVSKNVPKTQEKPIVRKSKRLQI